LAASSSTVLCGKGHRVLPLLDQREIAIAARNRDAKFF
jgi:hypothetical protein